MDGHPTQPGDRPSGSAPRLAVLSGLPIVLIGLVLWNLGNYAFFVIAGRAVGPEHYATVAALLAATMLVQIPSGAIQVGISRQIAVVAAGPPAVKALLRFAAVRLLILGTILGGLTALATLVFAPSLPRIDALWTGLAVLPMPLYAFSSGLVQGQQQFARFSATVSMLGVPRPLLLLAALPIMDKVTSTIAASALTIILATITAVALAWPPGPRDPHPSREVWQSFGRTIAPLAVGLTGFGALVNLDLIVARAALPNREAGLFGAVAVLGKATVIVPQAIAWILLPRISERRGRGQRTDTLLAGGIAICIVCVVAAAGVALLLGGPIVSLVFGQEYRDGGVYLAPLIATTGLLGLLLLLMNHQLGLGDDRFAVAIAVLAGLQGIALVAIHDSPWHLLLVELGAGILGVVVYEYLHGRTGDGLFRSIRALWAETILRHRQP